MNLKPSVSLCSFGMAATILSACLSLPAQAVEITKANNTDLLNLDSSWTTVAPTPSDVAVWDGTVTSANSSILGGDVSWSGIRIASPGGAVTIANIASGVAFTAVAASPTLTYTVAPTTQLVNGNRVTPGGTAPAGFGAGTSYFVVNATPTTFELSTTLGGPSITPTSTGTNPTVSGGYVLTLGSGGIDMSAATQNLTIASNVNAAASQSWNVASGRTLTLTGGTAGTGVITKSGAGNLNFTAILANTGGVILAGGTTTAQTGSFVSAFGGNPVEFQNGAIFTNGAGNNNTLTFNSNVFVGAGQSGTINMGNRLAWGNNTTTYTLTGSGTLNLNAATTVTRNDISADFTAFSGNVNFTGSGAVRLFINGGKFGAGFTNSTVDLGGSVNLQPQTNTPGNTVNIGSLSGSSATAVLGGGTAGSPNYTVGSLNQSTTYAGQIIGNAALTKVGTGTLTLTNTANVNTGATTITAGTLRLGAANVLSDTSNLVLNSGSLDLNGFSETMGTIDLNASSAIDFGAGTAALAFSNSAAVDWSTFTLTISNWTPGSDTFRVGTDGTGLTASQLSHITFAGFDGSYAAIDASGFVAPVPEPSVTASLGLAGLGLLAYRRMRAMRRIA